MQYLCTVFFNRFSVFLFFVGGTFYVVLKEMDGGDCNTEVADHFSAVNVFPLNVQFLSRLSCCPGHFIPPPPLCVWCICVLAYTVRESIHVLLCMHASWDVCVCARVCVCHRGR